MYVRPWSALPQHLVQLRHHRCVRWVVHHVHVLDTKVDGVVLLWQIQCNASSESWWKHGEAVGGQGFLGVLQRVGLKGFGVSYSPRGARTARCPQRHSSSARWCSD